MQNILKNYSTAQEEKHYISIQLDRGGGRFQNLQEGYSTLTNRQIKNHFFIKTPQSVPERGKESFRDN